MANFPGEKYTEHTDDSQNKHPAQGVFQDKIGDGEKVVAEVIKAGEAALREAKFRKTGLIIATCFIFLLSIALFLKIRQIDKKKSS
ncbi:unnamed protein product [marine sediment metagenome]|uniref:Uncharacterized protein n=1 Tax=marine sediment metagenome TaxID=412755 RepID=X1CEI2_9ZZZZ